MKQRKTLKRLRRLATLVGKHYLEHYGLRHTIRIFKTLLGSIKEGIEIDETTRTYLTLYIANTIVGDLIHSTKAALKDHLRHREFGVIIDREVWGSVDVARTITTYPSGLYASLTYIPTSKAPEYYLLREMIDRTLRIIEEVIDKAQPLGEGQNLIAEVITALKSNANKLRRLRTRLPKPNTEYTHHELLDEAGRLLPYSPSWFINAYETYRYSTYLRKTIYAARKRTKLSKHELVLLGWRLYEILIYIAILRILEENGYTIKERKPRRLVMAKGNHEIEILFNRPMENSIIISVNNDIEKAGKIRGRPDTSIKGDKNTIVVECKFSENPTYITAGRYKVMAYMYEYNADLGILVFPGFNARRIYDEEDRATMSLWEIMERNNGVAKIILSNGRAIYMVKADPAEGESPEEAWSTIKTRLSNALAESGLVSRDYEVRS